MNALNLCYFFLKFRPRTEKEMIDYLHKKSEKYGFTEEIIRETIIFLEEEGLINDRKFIELFVRGRILRRPKSSWVLKRELVRYGISNELIEQYFSVNELDEQKLALQALQKKWDRFKDLPKLEKLKKIHNYLRQRGFAFTTIKKAIQKLEENNL